MLNTIVPVSSAAAPFAITETGPGNIALARAIRSSAIPKAVMTVDENRAIMCYVTAMKVVAGWLARGLITEEDYSQIDTIMAEKFGVSTRSIWRRNSLMFLGAGGNMPATKGGLSDAENSYIGSTAEIG